MSAPNKQVTAVEWFAEQIEPYVLNRVSIPKYILNDLKEQAKAMEVEQMDYARRMSMLCSCDENEPTTKVHCCDSCGKIAEGYWVTKLHDYNPGC